MTQSVEYIYLDPPEIPSARALAGCWVCYALDVARGWVDDLIMVGLAIALAVCQGINEELEEDAPPAGAGIPEHLRIGTESVPGTPGPLPEVCEYPRWSDGTPWNPWKEEKKS